MSSDPPIIDVRQVPFWRRLDTILGALDRLPDGGQAELVADLDPWPLRSYLEATRAGGFEWTMLEAGPQVWRVRLDRRGD